MVVISIIGILSAVIIVALNNARLKARDARVNSDLSQIRKLMEFYYYDNTSFPNTYEEITRAVGWGVDNWCYDQQVSGRKCVNLDNPAEPNKQKQQIGVLAKDIINNFKHPTDPEAGMLFGSIQNEAFVIAPIPSTANGTIKFKCFDTRGTIKDYDSLAAFWPYFWTDCAVNNSKCYCQ